jgi:hypothetical protein
MGWENSLKLLQEQFNSKAKDSRGLHHLLVEVSDNERDRAGGPDWFLRESHLGAPNLEAYQRAERWCMVASSPIPSILPRFREFRPVNLWRT